MIELNSALDFTFFDEQGRVLKLRCGHVDVAHPNGWFAIYINNAMLHITDKEPEYRVTMITNFAVVQNWAKQVFELLLTEWRNKGCRHCSTPFHDPYTSFCRNCGKSGL